MPKVYIHLAKNLKSTITCHSWRQCNSWLSDLSSAVRPCKKKKNMKFWNFGNICAKAKLCTHSTWKDKFLVDHLHLAVSNSCRINEICGCGSWMVASRKLEQSPDYGLLDLTVNILAKSLEFKKLLKTHSKSSKVGFIQFKFRNLLT